MDDIRAQLAELMGSIEEDKGIGKDFTDDDVCKFYLTGLCPFQLFEATDLKQKLYRGGCDKIHSDELREKYLEARKTKRYRYEEELIRVIMPIVDEADKRILRGQHRCDEVEKQIDLEEELKKLDEDIQEKMKEAESLGAEGNVEASKRAMLVIAKMHKHKAKLIKIFENNKGETTLQKLKPCDVCGALLAGAVADTDKRLDEHYSGKIHVTIKMVREALQASQEYLRDQAPLIDAKNLMEKYQNFYGGMTQPIRPAALSALSMPPKQSKEKEIDYYKEEKEKDKSSKEKERGRYHHHHKHRRRSSSTSSSSTDEKSTKHSSSSSSSSSSNKNEQKDRDGEREKKRKDRKVSKDSKHKKSHSKRSRHSGSSSSTAKSKHTSSSGKHSSSSHHKSHKKRKHRSKSRIPTRE